MRTWYTIKALAGSDTADIAIYDEIGMWGITAREFNADLKKITAKNIDVTINSPGGSLFDALAMYNGLRNHGATITTKVMGVAASAASVVFMAGDKRVMPENTFLMVHNCIGPLKGNADEHREFADTLDNINQSIIKTYVARTGKTEDEVKALLDAETFLSAQEAKDSGFTDLVEPALKIAAEFDIARLPANVQASFKAAQDETTDPTDPAPAFADQVSALAQAAGLSEFAPLWALGTTDIKAVEANIATAREIKALCVLALQPEAADAYIRSAKPLAEVRADLIDKLAAIDAKAHVDTAKPTGDKTTASAQPTAFKTSDVWASRRQIIK
jgi:ATP-dependent Clp protease protease subunit